MAPAATVVPVPLGLIQRAHKRKLAELHQAVAREREKHRRLAEFVGPDRLRLHEQDEQAERQQQEEDAHVQMLAEWSHKLLEDLDAEVGLVCGRDEDPVLAGLPAWLHPFHYDDCHGL